MSTYPPIPDEFDVPSAPGSTPTNSPGDADPPRTMTQLLAALGAGVTAVQTELESEKDDRAAADAAHVIADDAHPGYVTEEEAQAKVDAHAAEEDPHPDYETSAEAQAKVDTHAAAVAHTTVVANNQIDNYQLVAGDAGKVIEMNKATAVTLTVPANADVPFPVGTVIEVWQQGAGQVTIAAAGSVTLYTPFTAKIARQYATAVLRKRATNEWALEGDLELA